MHVAFYSHKNTFRRWISFLFSRPYVHCAFYDPKYNEVFDISDKGYKWQSTSEVPDFLWFIPEHLERNLQNALTTIVGKGYDYKGVILNTLFGIRLQNPNQYYCSEMVATVLKMIGRYKGDTLITPQQLYEALT